MEKESIIDYSKLTPKIKMLKGARRVIIGYKPNKYGEVIVTTGIPVELKPDAISYKDVKSETYESYMTRQLRNRS